jgi:hypothetical protein
VALNTIALVPSPKRIIGNLKSRDKRYNGLMKRD